MGRNPKPADEKYIRKDYKLPPDLVKRIEATIPPNKRSMFMKMAAEHMLDMLEGKKPKIDSEIFLK